MDPLRRADEAHVLLLPSVQLGDNVDGCESDKEMLRLCAGVVSHESLTL